VKSRAAALLGCCERLIGKYIRWYPSVRRAYGQAWRGRGHSGRLGRGGRYLRFTAEEVAAALLQAKGNREEAARKLDCRLETVNLYLQRYRVVRAALQEAREVRLDHVESKLADAVDAGEWRAVSFVLVHLGKERGYDRKRPLQPRVRPSSMPRDFPKRVRETYARLAAKEAKEQQGKPRGLP